jgi:hypothetical protein
LVISPSIKYCVHCTFGTFTSFKEFIVKYFV